MKNRTSNFLPAFVSLILLLSLLSIPSLSQEKPLGQFDGKTDIGKVNKPGSATYDAEKQEYTIAGSGNNMWFDQDEFHFVWRRLKGNFILRTRAQFISKGVEEH